MSADFSVRLATNDDCKQLPDIEVSAGQAYADIGMHDVADETVPPSEAWEPYCESSTLWVAVEADDTPFGFLAAGVHGDLLFIYELAVAHEHQRRGVGRALMAAAEVKACALGLHRVFLTTFCDVPFNGPYYAAQGYAIIPDAELPNALIPVMSAERRRWSEPDRVRCAMGKQI